MNLIVAALTHDMAEFQTGDLPATVKWRNPLLKQVLDDIEVEFMASNNIPYDLTQEEEDVLKIADITQLCFKAIYELEMGNTHFSIVLTRGVRYLSGLVWPPAVAAPTAQQLWEYLASQEKQYACK